MDKLRPAVIVFLALINLISFAMCFADKKKAQRGKWRIPESTLLWMSFFGGAFGMLLGMKLFRHKTKHLKFVITVPLLCVIWTALLIFLEYRF